MKKKAQSKIIKKNILVIGGAGYIGSHIVDALCNLNHKVIVFDNLSSGFKENLNKKAELIVGDILNQKALEMIFQRKIDVVFHFAALKNVGESMTQIDKYSVNNLIGTINVLNAMIKNKNKYFIFSSSASVYGAPKYYPIDEKHSLNPESYYGFTKLEVERNLEWYSKIAGINYAALRYFNAAGYTPGKSKERNPGNLLPIVMEVAAGKRKEVQVYGNNYKTKDGTGVRDYIHVLDLADAHIRAMNYIIENKKNITVNLSTQKGSSVLDIITATEKITKKKIPYKIISRRAGDPATVVASSKLANKLLGWKPKHSEIKNIVSSMWQIYKK
ncbi:MAG: UDP-glucose 4-epimerase GalE [Candidatus Nanoarchaeia archaeon]